MTGTAALWVIAAVYMVARSHDANDGHDTRSLQHYRLSTLPRA